MQISVCHVQVGIYHLCICVAVFYQTKDTITAICSLPHSCQRAVGSDTPMYAGTWLVLDGEAIPYKRIYAEVHKSLCRVIVA